MISVLERKSMGAIRWKLKVVMADRDMSAKKLAELTGLSYGAIIKLRNEDPVQVNISTLTAFCNALNCTTDELIEYLPD